MIYDDKFRTARTTLWFWGLWAWRLSCLKPHAGFGFRWRRPSLQNASPASDRRQLAKFPLTQHSQATNAGTLLRHRARDLVAQGLDQPAKLLEARLMGDIINPIELNADENGARHRLFCLHGREGSTKVQRFIVARRSGTLGQVNVIYDGTTTLSPCRMP